MWNIVVKGERLKETKNWFLSQLLDAYGVLVIRNLDFRFDINLLFFTPGRIHSFSGSHLPQPTYPSHTHSLDVSVKHILWGNTLHIHYSNPSSFDFRLVL